MSYEKTTTEITDLEDAVAEALADAAVTIAPATVAAAGSTVLLDSGETVWIACVPSDDPVTPQIEFLVVAIACDDETPIRRSGGQLVAVVTLRGIWPDVLALHGVSTIRKACMMIALGEPQPQAEGADVIPLPAADRANGCIRTALDVANQVAAPLDDVL